MTEAQNGKRVSSSKLKTCNGDRTTCGACGHSTWYDIIGD